MNELPNDEFDDETLDTQETTEKSGKHKKKLANHIANLPVFSFKENSTCDDLLAQHLKLQVINKIVIQNFLVYFFNYWTISVLVIFSKIQYTVKNRLSAHDRIKISK